MDLPSSESFPRLVSLFTFFCDIIVPFCVNIQYNIIPLTLLETLIHLPTDVEQILTLSVQEKWSQKNIGTLICLLYTMLCLIVGMILETHGLVRRFSESPGWSTILPRTTSLKGTISLIIVWNHSFLTFLIYPSSWFWFKSSGYVAVAYMILLWHILMKSALGEFYSLVILMVGCSGNPSTVMNDSNTTR